MLFQNKSDMPKLLTLSTRKTACKFSSCLHRYIIFWTCQSFLYFTFNISREVLYYNWSQLKPVNSVLTSYIKLRNVYVNFKRTNQSCSSSKISKSMNFELRTCDRTCFQWKQERLWSSEKLRNILIKKYRDMANFY